MSNQSKTPIPDPQDAPKLDENELRETPETIQRIGPADDDAEETMRHLDEDGYDNMGENYYGSNPVTESEQPNRWLNDAAVDRSQVTHHNDAKEE